MDARYLSGNLRVRKVVAGNHFQVSAYFVIFKSHPIAHEGVDPKFLCQVNNKDSWGPAVWPAGATRRTESQPLSSGALPSKRDTGRGICPKKQARAALSDWGLLSTLNNLFGGSTCLGGGGGKVGKEGRGSVAGRWPGNRDAWGKSAVIIIKTSQLLSIC